MVEILTSSPETLTPIPVLLYHSVVADPRRNFDVSIDQFTAQLQFLREQEFDTLSVDDLARKLTEGVPLSERTAAVTFDDGCASFANYALPVLVENSIRSTVYVESAHVGTAGRDGVLRMDGGAIAAAIQAGVSIGAHSRTHAQLDIASSGDAWREIADSRSELSELTGTEVSSFAYPHGFYSNETSSMVKRAGYSSAVAVKNAFSHRLDDPFAIARITITGDTQLDSFKNICNGDGRPLAWRRERLRTTAWRWGRRIEWLADRA
jgi:peptidoglycan/xylan/chitin deacetylase (PgdA/CDA1 family)